jgi:hypothetical protein
VGIVAVACLAHAPRPHSAESALVSIFLEQSGQHTRITKFGGDNGQLRIAAVRIDLSASPSTLRSGTLVDVLYLSGDLPFLLTIDWRDTHRAKSWRILISIPDASTSK